MAFDFKKPFCTRDGHEARVYAYDGAGALSIHGAIKIEGAWIPMAWTPEGLSTPQAGLNPADLVNTPRKFRHEVVALVFENDFKLFDDTVKLYRWLSDEKINKPYGIKLLVIETDEGEGGSFHP